MQRPPFWTWLSSALAPCCLIGGWTLAAGRQPPGYDASIDTISALAALGARDRWLMTSALLGLGLCHVLTAFGLRAAATGGRWVLAAGGIGTLLVAAFPLTGTGPETAHFAAASVAFFCLSAWPLFAMQREAAATAAFAFRPLVASLAAVSLLGLLFWFATQLFGAGARIGFAERTVAAAQAFWPLLAVISAR